MKKGFTLIELLVVVLIIGILSSVALPQYRKAVLRARMAELHTNMAIMKKAFDYAVLTGRTGSSSYMVNLLEEAGMELSGGTYNSSKQNYTTNNWQYRCSYSHLPETYGADYYSLLCNFFPEGSNEGSVRLIGWSITKRSSGTEERKWCSYSRGNDTQQSLCASLASAGFTSSAG